MPDSLRLNEYGFYEIKEKPTPEALREYYEQRYYQEELTTYTAAYSPEELEHFDGMLRLRHWVLENLPATAATPPAAASSAAPRKFLDIGCGEGWALAYFKRQGWDVLGLDFSSFALTHFHADLLAHLRTGDLFESLHRLVAEGQQFDVLWLDNVLEHVVEPAELLRLCRRLVAPGGALLVDVPNDFSTLQQHVLSTGEIDRPFWVVLPDHLSYFNQTGLRNLAEATGWQVARLLADHPIDLNLLTPHSNYVMNRAVGKAAHRARIAQDSFLLRTAPLPAVATYYEALAGVGLGRSIVAFLQPA
ncbi:class I SAM-dependent methyltransferase [Hymenobacter sp. BT683]|uniref:Class I SAM-dependent methyltransferase n=1 Tax=Hymenobacter jeongseonensis TaxID=2791027 RepID=A0ABS0IGD3_9BACT|nr:class I SAM-dependent methyltransferase [Hymenobacter jeongseonensis]